MEVISCMFSADGNGKHFIPKSFPVASWIGPACHETFVIAFHAFRRCLPVPAVNQVNQALEGRGIRTAPVFPVMLDSNPFGAVP